jgi:Zn-dependent alcohol dehydrogenase
MPPSKQRGELSTNGSWSDLASEDNVEEVQLDDPGDGEVLVEMFDELVTTVYPLDGIHAAYDDMRNGRNIRGIIHFAK